MTVITLDCFLIHIVTQGLLLGQDTCKVLYVYKDEIAVTAANFERKLPELHLDVVNFLGSFHCQRDLLRAFLEVSL